jgi:hypothetical protein
VEGFLVRAVVEKKRSDIKSGEAEGILTRGVLIREGLKAEGEKARDSLLKQAAVTNQTINFFKLIFNFNDV